MLLPEMENRRLAEIERMKPTSASPAYSHVPAPVVSSPVHVASPSRVDDAAARAAEAEKRAAEAEKRYAHSFLDT